MIASSGAAPPARVLVADDDRDLVDILRMVLEEHGYTVLVAYGPADALAVVEAERPDLLVLDVMMPEGAEGFHVVWTLRQHPDAYHQRLPIILLTAIHQRTHLRFHPDSGDGTYAAGEFLPIEEFVDKPVDPDGFVRTVARVLEQARRVSRAP